MLSTCRTTDADVVVHIMTYVYRMAFEYDHLLVNSPLMSFTRSFPDEQLDPRRPNVRTRRCVKIVHDVWCDPITKSPNTGRIATQVDFEPSLPCELARHNGRRFCSYRDLGFIKERGAKEEYVPFSWHKNATYLVIQVSQS
jgi:hypothetical protein